ncbi:MAG: hypothetical protein ABSD08_11675 [Xanthobacteraceae bacterium]|jgi:hypothetical protein
MAKREFRWQLSERQWAYLGWLVRNTGLGRIEKDVAQYLLNQKIQEMRLTNYKEPQPEGDMPSAADGAGPKENRGE